MSTDPLDQADLRQRVQKSLNAFVAGQTPFLDGISEELSPLTDALSDLVAGGKRLRPAFCYWGYRGAGGADGDAIIDAAAPWSSSRRAPSSTTTSWTAATPGAACRRCTAASPACTGPRPGSATRRPSAWARRPARRPVPVWSDEMLGRSGLPAERLLAGCPGLRQMRTELMGGQYLDLLEQARGGGSVERALRVARYKSAKYTIEKPLHLGAPWPAPARTCSTATPATGCRSARPSSCATTCSACSATRR
jgi:geranylgeranyl diphosphate synthase type I